VASHRQRQILQAGSRAPDFELAGLDGRKHRLRDLIAGGPVLFAFYKSACPVCQLTLPFLDRIHRGQGAPALSIYAISQDDAETAREFNREFGITFPTLLDAEDENYPASNAYGISYVPSIFLLETDGVIARTIEGFDRKELEALGARAGVATFTSADRVPAFKAG
jgi:peroxiredoxin